MIITRKLLLATAAGIAVLGMGAPAASASTGAVTQVIKVKTVQTSSTQPTPLSIVFTESLWQGGRWVGHDSVRCVWASPTATTGQCRVSVWFANAGRMFLEFMNTQNSTVHGKIDGGTGAFEHAHGWFVHTSDPSNSNIGWATLWFSLAH